MGRFRQCALCALLCTAGVGELFHPQSPVNITDRIDQGPLTPSGLVVTLRHNLHHEKNQGHYEVMFSPPKEAPVERMYGGHSGALLSGLMSGELSSRMPAGRIAIRSTSVQDLSSL